MQLKTKINLKKYILLGLIPTIILALFLNSIKELSGHLIVYCATLVNHYLLLRGVSGLLGQNPGESRALSVLFIIIKMGVIFFGLYVGVLFMGNKVIISLVNYVLLIVVLGVSTIKG